MESPSRRLITAAVLLMLMTGALLWTRRPRQTAFYVQSATFQFPFLYDSLRALAAADTLQDLDAMTVPAHRLVPGRGTIIAHRWYSPGSLTIWDDEHYKKLTVWLPHGLPKSSSAISLGSDSAVAVYSEGSSSWPWEHCYGYLRDGRMEITRAGGLGVVGLDIVEPVCQNQVRRVRLRLAERHLETLSPFDGYAPPESLTGTGIQERHW